MTISGISCEKVASLPALSTCSISGWSDSMNVRPIAYPSSFYDKSATCSPSLQIIEQSVHARDLGVLSPIFSNR